MRMSRRQGLLGSVKLLTMQELFGDAVLVAEQHNANVSSSTGTFSISLSGIDTSIPLYSVYLSGGSVEFAKIVGATKTQLSAIGERVVSVSSSEVTSSPAYGGTICLFRFPDFSTAQIDRLLSRLAINDVTWRATNGSTYIRASYTSLTRTNAAVHIVFANQTSYPVKFCFSISSGDELPTLSTASTPLFSTSISATENIIHLYDDSANSRYAVSWDGAGSVVVPVGGIYELTFA